jgi:monooxygenase
MCAKNGVIQSVGENVAMTTTMSRTKPDVAVQHFDVLIAGAGISGIGAAHHLAEQLPDKSFVLLESKDTFGGTWRTHHYPGTRSDSDLYTFGYRFKPWVGPPIATAEKILKYLQEVVDDDQLEQHIRYHHTIKKASWSSNDQLWTLEVLRTSDDEVLHFTCNFLWMCQGYFRHEKGFTPNWDGFEKYRGTVIHPQTWPDDVSLAGKNVVVIGSGATAATLIPNIADECAHVTMLQRSPTFFYIRDNVNELADLLREVDTPEEWVHEIVRRRIIFEFSAITDLALAFPELAREELLKPIREMLGPDFDVDKHFNPSYRPWQQRIAMVPEGDFFKAVQSGKASVVTDEIVSFSETGIQLKSGETLEADVVITATGFELSIFGDIPFLVDDEPYDFAKSVTYRGMMFTGLPNLVQIFGYFRASWTLRVDIIGDFVCRLLNHMDELSAHSVVPALRDEDQGMALRPWVDPEEFNPSYLKRAVHLMPRQGNHEPWIHPHSYIVEKEELPRADLDDGSLIYK